MRWVVQISPSPRFCIPSNSQTNNNKTINNFHISTTTKNNRNISHIMKFLTVLLLLLPLADTFLTSSRYPLTFNRGKMISSSTSVQERKIMPSFTRLNYQEKDNSFQELTKNFNHLSQIAKVSK